MSLSWKNKNKNFIHQKVHTDKIKFKYKNAQFHIFQKNVTNFVPLVLSWKKVEKFRIQLSCIRIMFYSCENTKIAFSIVKKNTKSKEWNQIHEKFAQEFYINHHLRIQLLAFSYLKSAETYESLWWFSQKWKRKYVPYFIPRKKLGST